MTPNARTLNYLRDQGRLVGIVEKWNPAVRIRQDLWGMIDLVEVGPGGVFYGHQPTSDNGGNVSKHLDKLRRQKNYELYLRSGGKLFVWGWAKKGPRGKVKRWTPRIIEMTLEAYPPLEPLQIAQECPTKGVFEPDGQEQPPIEPGASLGLLEPK